jgi:hypothetical protein
MIQFNEQMRVVVDLYLWGVERKEQIAGIRLGWTGRADQSLQSPLSPPRSFSGFWAPPISELGFLGENPGWVE